MTKWDGIRYFNPNSQVDHWGDASRMNRELIEELDDFRDYLGFPLYVTSAYRHLDQGQHGKGNAVDVVCPDIHFFDLYLKAERFDFGGIGIYPHWFWKRKNNIVGGLHIDKRANHARWLCIKIDGKQQYFGLNYENLIDYEVF